MSKPLRHISISPVTAIAIVAIAMAIVAVAGMFFLSRSSLHLSKEKGVVELTPASANSSSP